MTTSSRSSASTWALFATLAAAGTWGGPACLAASLAPVLPELRLEQLFDPFFIRAETVRPHAPEVITRQIAQDARGDVWLATFSGVVRYDGEVFTNVTNEASLQPARAFALLLDRKENLWIGTLGAGVYRYDGSTYTQLTARDGLSSDRVLSMMEDRDGNLWFGHEGAGATRYDGTRFTAFGARDGLTDGDVTSMAQDETGRIWFGTREGLFHFDGESFDAFEEAGHLPTGGHIPTLIDSKGHLWIAGIAGLHHYDGARLRQVTKEPVWAMEERTDGYLWFGGETTLHRLRPGSVVGETEPEIVEIGSVGGLVFDLFEDRDGVLWIATVGVARLEGGRIRHFVAAPAPRDPSAPDASEQRW
ncbi:MAG TPA: two-component regulator propeller domain-containing protein [Thermoanaerobaculia bacterium]|nr:two-component regulator propeller domain-containing protein [Thermoanaerobaculia bacterium]